VVQDVLKEYTSNNKIRDYIIRYANEDLEEINKGNTAPDPININEEHTSKYIFYIIFFIRFNTNINIIEILTRIRRIAVLTKYTDDIRTLFLEGIEKAKRERKLPPNYNKKVIPLGKYIYSLLNIYNTY
jgi:hypothetical protein